MATNIVYRNSTNPTVPSSTIAKGTPLTSAEIDGNFKSIQNTLDQLLYQAPSIGNSFTINGVSSRTIEIGSSVNDVSFSWSLTGSTPTSQSISNGVGSIPVGTTTKSIAGTSFSTSQSWALTVSGVSPSGQSVSTSASVSLNVSKKRYWGTSTLTSLNSTDIIGLSSEFSTTKSKSITYDATGGKYLYYAYPVSFGPMTNVTVNGLPFSDYTQTSYSFTNASGYVDTYYVIRFNGIQNGSSIQVVYQ